MGEIFKTNDLLTSRHLERGGGFFMGVFGGNDV